MLKPALTSYTIYSSSLLPSHPWHFMGLPPELYKVLRYTYFQYIVIRQSLTIILPLINFGDDTFTMRVKTGKWCRKGSLQHHNICSNKTCGRTTGIWSSPAGRFLHVFLSRDEHFSVNNADQGDYFVDKIGRQRLPSGLRVFFLFLENQEPLSENDGLYSSTEQDLRRTSTN